MMSTRPRGAPEGGRGPRSASRAAGALRRAGSASPGTCRSPAHSRAGVARSVTQAQVGDRAVAGEAATPARAIEREAPVADREVELVPAADPGECRSGPAAARSDSSGARRRRTFVLRLVVPVERAHALELSRRAHRACARWRAHLELRPARGSKSTSASSVSMPMPVVQPHGRSPRARSPVPWQCRATDRGRAAGPRLCQHQHAEVAGVESEREVALVSPSVPSSSARTPPAATSTWRNPGRAAQLDDIRCRAPRCRRAGCRAGRGRRSRLCRGCQVRSPPPAPVEVELAGQVGSQVHRVHADAVRQSASAQPATRRRRCRRATPSNSCSSASSTIRRFLANRSSRRSGSGSRPSGTASTRPSRCSAYGHTSARPERRRRCAPRVRRRRAATGTLRPLARERQLRPVRHDADVAARLDLRARAAVHEHDAPRRQHLARVAAVEGDVERADVQAGESSVRWRRDSRPCPAPARGHLRPGRARGRRRRHGQVEVVHVRRAGEVPLRRAPAARRGAGRRGTAPSAGR